ncbi:MAG: hypothetical protein BIFFINMI_03047 [Phycisphaerae bacterium]|nr:hypothetical protein [Phycisphaerae bacterium]
MTDDADDIRFDEPPRAEELLDLLHRQHKLYQELHRLAQQQRSLIAAEDPSGLLAILSSRQRLIDQLSRINSRLEPVRADWKRIEQRLSTEQRKTAGRLVEQVGQLLAEILAADEADSRTLSARKAATGEQIRNLAAGSQVQAAYRRAAGAAPHAAGSTFDQSSD